MGLSRLLLVAFLITNGLAALRAAEADVNAVTSVGTVDDPNVAMRKFRVAPGLKVGLFAAEPMLRNVVSFGFDEKGRCYAVESNRRRTSVFDIRGLSEWLDADFSFRTLEDRANFLKTNLAASNPKLSDFLKAKRNLLSDFNQDGAIDWRDLEVESERIRLLVDTNGDGRADAATTLAEGFDGITSGVAAGVLARKGEVWFTCIPDLWRMTNTGLRITSGLPSADALPINPHLVNRKSQIVNLLHGFGVHIAFGGHDLHGLIMGPDGKIYFSIADRGTSTNLWNKIIDHWPGLTMEALADSGAVFRCNPDGTALEVIAIGLRNPQELAFDDAGNLFTGDNNGDGGDKARWEHIVEGADYGWRMGWQWLPKMGAWNSEMLWGMAPSNTSSYYLPPVAHIGAGPSGVAFYPGTGLPSRYDRHFFMCDFRGGPNSMVRSFALRPRGASFEAFDETEFINGFLCTDIEFGPDGGVYVSDWVKGWDKTDKGRIYRVFDPAQLNSLAVIEVKKLLAEGFEKRTELELARLLGHQDMRVRLEAQWELATRSQVSDAAFDRLANVAEKGETKARLHAVWAFSQIAQAARRPAANPKLRKRGEAARQKLWLRTGDPDSDVRGHAAKLYWEAETSAGWFPDLITKPNPRVQLLALQGMAAAAKNLNSTPKGLEFSSNAVLLLRDVLRQNADADPYLRHEAVFALARIGDIKSLLAVANDASPSVRMGVCLALRRLQRPEVAHFLQDADPKIVLEAARAIHDGPIPSALPALAKLLPDRNRVANTPATTFTLRRALSANFRLGDDANAKAVAALAADPTASAILRIEALELLSTWARPPGRDHVVGLWRPLPARDGVVAVKALEPLLASITAGSPAAVKAAAAKTAGALGLTRAPSVASVSGNQRVAQLASILEKGSVPGRQNSLSALAAMNDPAATQLLSAWLGRLVAGQVPKELQLDVLEAVQNSKSLSSTPATKSALVKFESARNASDPIAKWRECLQGGSAEAGKQTFIERQDAACFRCHKIKGEGGEVGPEMAGLGQRQTREHILESILFPNKHISPGFETVLVTLKNGSSYAGMIKSENAMHLVINSPEDGLITVKKADIQARDRGLSSMPEELGSILSKQDLRNLVEFLSTLK